MLVLLRIGESSAARASSYDRLNFRILRSRSWVAEEGEIFRKGNKLLGPEEMEGEYAGEELRIEVRRFSFQWI